MPRLILMRHAKSAWNTTAAGDHDRPLNGRGRRNAPHMGELLVARGLVPDCVISSDACRTRETWDGMSAAMPGVDPIFTRRLYLPGLEEIAEVVLGLNESVETALLLGHNPGFSMASGWLSGQHIELKTAHAAILEADIGSWLDAFQPGIWRLETVLTPHDEGGGQL